MSKVGITDLRFHGKPREFFFFFTSKEKKIKFDEFFVKIKLSNYLLCEKVVIFFFELKSVDAYIEDRPIRLLEELYLVHNMMIC